MMPTKETSWCTAVAPFCVAPTDSVHTRVTPPNESVSATLASHWHSSYILQHKMVWCPLLCTTKSIHIWYILLVDSSALTSHTKRSLCCPENSSPQTYSMVPPIHFFISSTGLLYDSTNLFNATTDAFHWLILWAIRCPTFIILSSKHSLIFI